MSQLLQPWRPDYEFGDSIVDWNKGAIVLQLLSGGKSERMRNSANTGTFIRLYFDFLSRFLRLDFFEQYGPK
jgi:hypothetical protein